MRVVYTRAFRQTFQEVGYSSFRLPARDTENKYIQIRVSAVSAAVQSSPSSCRRWDSNLVCIRHLMGDSIPVEEVSARESTRLALRL